MVKKIVILILLVLFILVISFTIIWSNFRERILGISNGEGVDSTIQVCETACTMQAENDYCIKVRRVDIGEQKIDGTCYELAESLSNLGFVQCADISCP